MSKIAAMRVPVEQTKTALIRKSLENKASSSTQWFRLGFNNPRRIQPRSLERCQVSKFLHKDKRQDGMWPIRYQKHIPKHNVYNTNVSRNQAGVQPFMRNRGPSSRSPDRRTCKSPYVTLAWSLRIHGSGLLLFQRLTVDDF